jgi:hypothetical protein
MSSPAKDYAQHVWQLHGPDEWNFGVMVRGVVRNWAAYVYWDEEKGWRWNVLSSQTGGGYAASLMAAIDRCEQELGLSGGGT